MAQQQNAARPQTQNGAPAQPPPDPMKLVEQMLTERMSDIEAALPPLLKKQAKDFVRMALVDLPRQRSLLEVAARSPARVLIALMDIARMGLFPGTKLGEAYVVPFKNKGAWDCQAILGYRGLIKLARRSGEIADIRARVVSEGDEFEIVFGTSEHIIHKPAPLIDRGDWTKMIGIYCIADFRGGGQHVEWMSKSEIWEIAKRSATYSHHEGRHLNGPWTTDDVEMAKKTVARRGSKWWPLAVDAAEAIGRDEEREIVVEAEEPRSSPLALGMGGGFKTFDSGMYSEPEAEPEPVAQAAPQPQQAPQEAAPEPAPARKRAHETTPPDRARKQASGPTAPPPPIGPEEAAAILRREAEEARGHGD